MLGSNADPATIAQTRASFVCWNVLGLVM